MNMLRRVARLLVNKLTINATVCCDLRIPNSSPLSTICRLLSDDLQVTNHGQSWMTILYRFVGCNFRSMLCLLQRSVVRD